VTPPRPSLGRRYRARLLAGALILPLNASAQAIGNRFLGPAGLGIYSYTVGILSDVLAFADSGLGTAHYRRLCSGEDPGPWLRLFTRLVAGLMLAFVAALVAAHWAGLGAVLWEGVPFAFVLWGAGIAVATWLVSLIGKSSDAHGLTSQAEWIRVLVRIGVLAAVGGLAWAGQLRLPTFFLVQLGALLVLLVAWTWQLERAGHGSWTWGTLPGAEARREAGMAWSFMSPLLAHAGIGMAAGVFDRWMLLTSAGPAAQGYYAVGLQLGAICFAFTGALTQLLMGEYTRAFAVGDHARLRTLFRESVAGMYLVACAGGLFCAVNVDRIVAVFAGESFGEGRTAILLLCLYPLHQTYGQLSGSLFLATGQTRRYSLIGVAAAAAGIPATWLLLAPAAGNLGAAGLAIKVVASQLLVVNLQLYHNARYLGLPLGGLVGEQLAIPAAVGGCAWVAARLTMTSGVGGVPGLLLNGALYGLGLLGAAWALDLAGARRHLRSLAGRWGRGAAGGTRGET
jgi:O-antigen/teichoic acid export membrane protein